MTTDTHDMVRELTDKHIHRERYETHRGHTKILRDHITTNPALLDQLEHAVQAGGVGDDGQRGYASKPTARLDALDTLIRIDYEARELLTGLGGDPNADTKTLIRRIAATNPTNPNIKRWWTWARVITGWDLPAWSPDNTCPACATRGTLRIRLIDHIASCINDQCRAIWDHTTIGLLADHIRTENDDEAA